MKKTTFKIPCLPPSVNAMYKINYRTKQCYLDESVRKFKREAFPYIPAITGVRECSLKGNKLNVTVEYHGKFLNKNGTIKRRDGQNLDKCLYDVIFEKLGIDDKHAWCGKWSKHHNPDEEFTIVTIEELI